ncbi:hypothetical protein D3C81_1759610 [compost metagenome]
MSNLLYGLTADKHLQCQNQLQLLAPAAKAQPGFFDHQPGQIAFAHREMVGPLAQCLPYGGLCSHCLYHDANFRVR